MLEYRVEQVDPIFDGFIVRLERRHVQAGEERFEREIVVHPGAVAIVAIDDRNQVVLIEQYRASVGRRLLETPAGTCDVLGEQLMATAARELEEETGFRAQKLEPLGRFLNSPGYCDQQTEVFLATALEEVGRAPAGVEEVDAEVRLIDLRRALEMVEEGSITDVTTCFGLLMAARRLGG